MTATVTTTALITAEDRQFIVDRCVAQVLAEREEGVDYSPTEIVELFEHVYDREFTRSQFVRLVLAVHDALALAERIAARRSM